jgi:hypothetical protein
MSTQSTKRQAGSPEQITGLQEQIRNCQVQLRQAEGEAVTRLIQIGGVLGHLKKATHRDWAVRVREVDYEPLEASRLLKISAGWWIDEIGTPGSELATCLPADVKKLEWLCRLSREQFALLRENVPNFKELPRTKLVALVKELLGLVTKARPKPTLTDSIKQLFDQMEVAIAQADNDVNESVTELESLFEERVEKVRQSLKETVAETVAA